MKSAYSKYVKSNNARGSNKASSYVRALDLLNGTLQKTQLFDLHDFWSVQSIELIEKLYQYALQFQKQEGSVFLLPGLPPSYGRNGYYSAALKSYGEFLITTQYEQPLWETYNRPDATPEQLAKELAKAKVIAKRRLIIDAEVDFATKEGRDAVREVKARLDQGFFRKMILDQYQTQCCVTGLNVPDVLRASHIVGWAADAKNRLNPANGLCLSATYDAAFDRHLISFDEDCRMILSPSLKEYVSNEAFKSQFLAFEGLPISRPKRFSPDQSLLQKHRAKLQ